MGMVVISENPDVVWTAKNTIFANIMEYVFAHINPDPVLKETLEVAMAFEYLEINKVSQAQKDAMTKLVYKYYESIAAEDSQSESPRTFFMSKIQELHSMLEAISA